MNRQISMDSGNNDQDYDLLNLPIRTYRIPREKDKLYEKLTELYEEYVSLNENSVQRKILIAQKIGCIKYAIGRSDLEISKTFQKSAESIPLLLKNRSIEPSLAIASWGIAALGKRNDILDMLKIMDYERLGSTHGVPRYVRIMTLIFQGMQAAALNNKQKLTECLINYKIEYERKRTNRKFGNWSRGLYNILEQTKNGKSEDVDMAITRRYEYLEESYCKNEELLEYEGLLDVHGLGVLAAVRLGGLGFSTSGIALPTHMIG